MKVRVIRHYSSGWWVTGDLTHTAAAEMDSSALPGETVADHIRRTLDEMVANPYRKANRGPVYLPGHQIFVEVDITQEQYAELEGRHPRRPDDN